MKKVFLVCLFLLLLVGCASKEPKIVAVFPTITECPVPERPVLKTLPKGHIGSKKVLSTILENFNMIELYSAQLENSLNCYEKQIDATRKAVEEQNLSQ